MRSALSGVHGAVPDPSVLIDRAHAMIPRLAARRSEIRQCRRLPAEIVDEMTGAGFFRVLQPYRWGGYEMDPTTFYDVEIALSQGDMPGGWVYGVLGVHPWLVGLMDDRAAATLA
jgi:3-hydroxy-9,10-secoandrosta-1,3,5(10)-triene-9,17-dione monooxygenase